MVKARLNGRHIWHAGTAYQIQLSFNPGLEQQRSRKIVFPDHINLLKKSLTVIHVSESEKNQVYLSHRYETGSNIYELLVLLY